jgi:hypothetical protein
VNIAPVAWKRPLRPMTILLAGSAGVAVVSLALCFFFPVGRCRVRDILFLAAGGVGCGSVVFAPIAIALGFRRPLKGWLAPRAFAVRAGVALLMAASLGYIVASARHDAFDGLTMLGILFMFLGAAIETMVGIVLDPESERPTNEGQGPEPPGAPVRRPPGGKPPTLSAKARPGYDPAEAATEEADAVSSTSAAEAGSPPSGGQAPDRTSD